LWSVAHTDCDGNGYSGCKRYTYRDSYSYSDRHCYNPASNSDANVYGEAQSDTKASPDAAAKAIR